MPVIVHQFKVDMTCGGCSSAVERVLAKLPDIQKVDINLDKKIVLVTSLNLSGEQILQTIQKTGKESSYLGELK